jgi:hypothetical protein
MKQKARKLKAEALGFEEILCCNEEGGKSLGVGGRKWIIDFCLAGYDILSIFKAFAQEK